MSGVALVVLDCDGVILESVSAKTEAFRRLFLDYGEEAAERMVDYHLRKGGVSRFRKFAWFYREIVGREISATEEAALNERFMELCLERVLHSSFVAGALEFIEAWHRRLPLYVASGAPEVELQEIFRLRNLSGYFQGVYGSPPNKTELLANIVRQTGAEPDRVVMVGDSHTDLEAAVAVGTRFYGRGVASSRPGDGYGENLQGLSSFLDEGNGRSIE